MTPEILIEKWVKYSQKLDEPLLSRDPSYLVSLNLTCFLSVGSYLKSSKRLGVEDLFFLV